MRKNVAGQKICCQMVSASDGSAFTGSVTVYVTGDAGTQAIGSVGSGAATHEGNGLYSYTPSQAETNYDHIAFTFVGAGAIPATVQVYTRHDANVTHIEGADPSDTIRDAVVDDATRIDASALNTATGTTIPAILDDTDLIDDGTSGLAKIATDVAAILVDTGTTLPNTLTSMSGATFDTATDSLEALRNRGDAAWITATSVTVSDKTGFKLASDGLDLVTAWTVDVTGDITGNLSGSVGSVTGAVGSVTGNVGGNVTGSVGSVAAGGIAAASFAAGAITATVIATDAIDADALAADAIAEINATVDTAISDAALATAAALATVDNVVDAIKAVTDELPDSGALTSIATASALATVDSNVDDILEDTSTTIPSTLATIASYIDTEITAIDSVVDAIKVTTDKLDDTLEDDAGTYRFTTNALEQAPTGGSTPTAGEIADAVWTEALADHEGTVGSTAEALADAGGSGASAADIADAVLDEALSGHTTAGTLGKAVADVLADTGTDGVIVASFTTAAKAELQTEAADALNAYDPPTKAELDSGLAALNDLDAADIRTAVGLATANLDTQLGDLPTVAEFEARTLAAASYATVANQTIIAAYLDTEVAAILAAVDTEVAAIKAKTDNLPASPAATGDIPTASAIATAVFTTAMTESYAAAGAQFTLAQFSYIVHQSLFDSSRSGTTWTIEKLDQSTAAATVTYDDAANPTGAARAT